MFHFFYTPRYTIKMIIHKLTPPTTKKLIILFMIILGVATAFGLLKIYWWSVYKSPSPNIMVPAHVKIPGQFQGEQGPFVLVLESTQLSSHPREGARLNQYVKLSQRVRIVAYQKDWAFITSESGKLNLGWIQENQLAFPSQFKPSKWLHNTHKYRKGMLKGVVYPKPNNRFLVIWSAKGNGLSIKGRYQGTVMAYDDLIWLNKDTPDLIYDFFQIDAQSDQIISEQLYHYN